MLATSRSALLAASLLVATVTFPSAPVDAQDDVAAELNTVLAEKSQLEREVAQYRASMDLLRANGAGGVDSPALQALAEELGRTRARLRGLSEREQALNTALRNQAGGATAAGAEVTRLTSLLQGYYADAEAADTESVNASEAAANALAQTDLDSSKVLLSGAEGIAAINLISERLAKVSTSGYSRQRDIVFNVEVRRDGALISKSNHSLRPVGESQYICKLALRSGSARISVRDEQWRVQVDGPGDYLLTLYTPDPGDAQLHVIPVDELRATRWTETPTWLPPLGDSASRS